MHVSVSEGIIKITTQADQSVMVCGCFNMLAQELVQYQFELAHRYHLVNLSYVQNINMQDGHIELKGAEDAIPLARRRMKSFSKAWFEI